VETIRSDEDAGASELEIARRCFASRDAVRRALERFERYGHVERVRRGRGLAVVVVG
jgi:DNA-binding GntR family transcriptional regulator